MCIQGTLSECIFRSVYYRSAYISSELSYQTVCIHSKFLSLRATICSSVKYGPKMSFILTILLSTRSSHLCHASFEYNPISLYNLWAPHCFNTVLPVPPERKVQLLPRTHSILVLTCNSYFSLFSKPATSHQYSNESVSEWQT